MQFENKNVRVSNNLWESILKNKIDAEVVRRTVESPVRVEEQDGGRVCAVGDTMNVVLAPYLRGAEWIAIAVVK